jgi:mannan endo-1,6-alpha-mannosidase
MNAGKASINQDPGLAPITTGDRAGAGILTALLIAAWLGIVVWMFLGE